MTKTIIHIGMPKTGSTSLQNGVFMPLHNLGELNFLGRASDLNYYGELKNREDFNRSYNVPQPAMTSWETQNVLDNLKIKKGALNVISDENFTFPRSILHKECEIDNIQLLKKLIEEAKKEGEVEVLMVVRNQVDVIFSLYVHWVSYFQKRSKHLSIQDFIEKQIKGNNKFIAEINYSSWVELLTSFIGRENLTVLFYEDLRDDISHFSFEISKVLDKDPRAILGLLSERNHNRKEKNNDGSFSRVRRKKTNLALKLTSVLGENGVLFLKNIFRITGFDSIIRRKMVSEIREFVPNFTPMERKFIQELIVGNNQLINGGLSQKKLIEYGYI